MPDIDRADRLNLIQRLLLEAGCRTEDASPDLALVLPGNVETIDDRIAAVEAVASELASLASAERTLFRMSNQSE